MKKLEMIDAITEKTGYNREDIRTVVNVMYDIMFDTLLSGESVGITSVGTIYMTDVPARDYNAGKNHIGEKIHKPAMQVMRFRASKIMKTALAMKFGVIPNPTSAEINSRQITRQNWGRFDIEDEF